MGKRRGGRAGVIATAGLLLAAGSALAGAAALRRSVAAFKRQFVPVLLYHALSDDRTVRHDYIVQRRAFEAQMRWLTRRGYETVSGAALVTQSPESARPGRKRVAITFDDGFGSVYRHALPVLRGLGMSATVFLATDFAARGEPFPWPYGAGDPPLTVAEIRELIDAGFAIESHSCTHANLRSLDRASLRDELVRSHELIAAWTGAAPAAFAYPYGLFDARVLQAVADAGYAGAFGVHVPAEAAERFAMPRMLVRNQTTLLGFRLRVWGVHPYLKTRRWFGPLRPVLRSQRWAFW